MAGRRARNPGATRPGTDKTGPHIAMSGSPGLLAGTGAAPSSHRHRRPELEKLVSLADPGDNSYLPWPADAQGWANSSGAELVSVRDRRYPTARTNSAGRQIPGRPRCSRRLSGRVEQVAPSAGKARPDSRSHRPADARSCLRAVTQVCPRIQPTMAQDAMDRCGNEALPAVDSLV
jgi:hypothetical protein